MPSLADELASGVPGAHDEDASAKAADSLLAATDSKAASETGSDAGSTSKTGASPATPRAKGTGVAAMLKRFQGGAAAVDPAPAPATQAARRPSEAEVVSKHASQVLSESAASSLIADKETLPPSTGAHSLLDPDETISNPFASDPVTPTVGSDAAAADGESATSTTTPVRFSNTSELTSPWADGSHARDSMASTSSSSSGGSDGADAMAAASAHFSMISLGSNAGPSQPSSRRPSRTSTGSQARGDGSKRNTLTLAGDAATPRAPSDDSVGFLARQTARLSRDAKARNSIDGAGKLKENFDKLQKLKAHERQGSSANSPLARGATLAADTANGADDGALDDEEGDESTDYEFWGNVMSSE